MMKLLPATIAEIVRQGGGKRRNTRMLLKFVAILVGLVVLFSACFHVLMAYEGREHHLFDGVYWTFTVMTTLGFGDITFHSPIGRAFSVIVMLSGLVFLLMLLPFTFIEFFYAPWMAAQASARMPRTVPSGTREHVIFTVYEPTVAALIPRLEQYKRDYRVLVPDEESAGRLLELGVRVMIGEPDVLETWKNACAADAALIVATDSDIPNTNAVFTARHAAPRTTIIATAKEMASSEILPMAGATRVLRLDEMLGEFLARCVAVGSTRAHVTAEFGPLLIAEIAVGPTGLAGNTLRECGLREQTGLVAVGGWERGLFHPAAADLRLTPGMVLLVAGSRAQIDAFNRTSEAAPARPGAVVIVGGGRVGRAVARALTVMGQDFRIVERVADRSRDPDRTIVGDAADMQTLRMAGLLRARTVVITSREDDANIYLTVLCRRVRPDVQIIARATHERNVETLHRAGADFVMSYTSLAAGAVCNCLSGGDLLMIAEGLNAFRVQTPPKLVGRAIADSHLRENTGCSIVAIQRGEAMHINPRPDHVLEAADTLILVGTLEAESRFLESYPGAAIGARGTAALG
ncbi:potassium channel protein [Opitutales bacterium ASA1]|uniref:potassium channel family protein n=1 Tax=Congregicoccus parvus TaxID=3081749 RepID=UPI002B31DC2D|nr:potassium channel protein [Opitutales bacterium ASA1]